MNLYFDDGLSVCFLLIFKQNGMPKLKKNMFLSFLNQQENHLLASLNASDNATINFLFVFPCIISLIIHNKPTRCNSDSIVFINNYRYALHVSDAFCVHHQEHYKL